MANEGRSTDVRAYLQLLEQARQRTEQLADAQRRAQAASRFLVVDQGESDLMANEGRRTRIDPQYLADAARRKNEQLFGRDIEDPRRRVDAVVSGTNSLKGQVAQLSAPLRGQMVADIRAAEQEFMRLRASIDPSADAIAAAEARLRQLEATAKRLTALDTFRNAFGNLDEYLDSSKVKQAQGEMEALRGVLSGAKDTPRNRQRMAAAKQAYDDLFAAKNAEMELNRQGSAAPQVARDAAAKRTADAQTRAVNTAAAATGRSRSSVRRTITRGGDVGRMGGDTASLALNQLAFAVDDFMSSTGGLEFKLRAISNNITQMAFVLGGTTGLFIGLGAVFAGQLAVGIMKFMNNGKSAEDQTKALNDALTKQKALVDAVAESFKSLADELTGGTVSAGGKFRQDVVDLEKTQRQRREGALANASPDVMLAREEQKKIERQLEDETSPGRRAVLLRQLQAAKNAERTATRAASTAKAPTGVEVQGMLDASATSIEESRGMRSGLRSLDYRFREAAILDTFFGTADTGQIRRRSAGVNTGTSVEAVQSQIEALNKTNDELGKSAGRRVFGFDVTGEATAAEKRLAKNATAIAQLQDQLTAAIDAAMVELIKSISGPSQAIRDAQADVAEAIKQGVPSATMLQRELDDAASLLNTGLTEFQTAQQVENPAARMNLEILAQDKIDQALSRQGELTAKADALRYEVTVDPQMQAAAVASRAQDNLNSSGLGNGVLARRMREIEFDRESLRRQREDPRLANDPMSQRLFAESEQAMNQEIAAIEAATIAVRIFADSLSRASQEAKSNLGSAEQAADDARRADLGFSTPRTQEERRRTEADLERQRELEQRARTEVEVANARQEELAASPDGLRLRDINEQLSGGGVTGDAREALIRERAGIQGRMEAEARAGGERARAAVNESTMEEERRKQAARGRELMMTPDQKFNEETEAGLEAIRQEFGRKAEEGNGLIDQAGLAEAQDRFRKQREQEARTATISGRGQETFLKEREKFARDIRDPGGLVESMTVGAMDQAGVMNVQGRADLLRKGIENQMEQVAPMLQQFQDERKSAMLLGPSRAALNISDITTGQGASELTRLLRGDDSAKDVNLAELQKQTEKFDELITAIKDANPGVLL